MFARRALPEMDLVSAVTAMLTVMRLSGVRGRIAVLGPALIACNLLAWVWALVAFRHQPLLMGTALLAYAFGLRHAVDADHIAAIDNVTRKLMQ
jgi:high-affinity nickel-transport protein